MHLPKQAPELPEAAGRIAFDFMATLRIPSPLHTVASSRITSLEVTASTLAPVNSRIGATNAPAVK